MPIMLPSTRIVTVLAAVVLLLPLGEPCGLSRLVAAVFHQVSNAFTAEACAGLDHCAAYLVLAAAAARALFLCMRLL